MFFLTTIINVWGKRVATGLDNQNISSFTNIKELLNNMNELFYTINMEGRITYVNKKVLDMLGYKPEEVIGQFMWDLVPAQKREDTQEAVIANLNQARREDFRVTAVHKDGTRKIIRLNISPIITDGVLYGQMGLAEDVTELHQSEKTLKAYNRELQIMKDELMAANQQLQAVEEELRQQLEEAEDNKLALAEAHQQMEAIFNFLPDPTFVLDAKGRVTMWNQAVEDLTGVRAREILGRGNREYSRVFYGDRRPMSIDQSLIGQEPEEEELIVFSHSRIKPGQNYQNFNNKIYLSGKSSPLIDNKGRLLGAIESLRDITEIRKAQQALMDSEEKYRNIIESIEDGYFEVDYAGNFTFVNPWLYKAIGYDAKELLGNSYRIVMDEENGARVYDAFNHVYKTGHSTKGFDWQVMCKDGRKLYVETTILPIKEEDMVVGFKGIVRDISERQAAEEALRKSENLYRTIFETTGTAMLILEEDMTVSLINYEMERVTGIPKDEFEGKLKWTEVVAPEHRDMMRYYHYGRRKDEALAPRNYEFKLLDRDGIRRDMWLTIAMIPETNQSVTSLIDITDRKKAEEALKISEARYRAIVEDQTELICRYAPDGALNYVNETYARYFSRKREELLGKDFTVVFCAEDREALKQQVTELNIANPVITIENRVCLPGGVVRWQQWTHRAVFSDDGILLDYQSVGRDVTARRAAEEKLRYLSTHDALTGLYNRLYFEEQMQGMENGSCDPVGLIMCDLDGLKIINDTLGHEKGDRLLKAVAEVMLHSFRNDDIVARVGGDEFAILLPFSSREDVKNAVERIDNNINKYNQDNPEMLLSISLGYAVKQDGNTSIGVAFEEADNNMYREKLNRKLHTRNSIIKNLMKALETRDYLTEGHGDRMRDYMLKMADAIDYPQSMRLELELFAQFHDIGKVGIPDAVLFKHGLLNEEERTYMQRHCEIGNRIAFSAPELVVIADWILKHHEWWNGQGYPLGLKGEDIPLECRMLTIAAAYDAITSNRPYRQACSHSQALQELRRCAGTQFDPALVEKFIESL